MTNTNDRDALQTELDALPMMAVDLPNVLIILGDAFDVDPADLVSAMIDDPDNPPVDTLDEMREMTGHKEINTMIDVIMEAVDSSMGLPVLRRAILLIQAMEG